MLGRGWSLATHGTRTTAPRGSRPPAPCLGMAGRALAPTAPYLCGVQGVGSGSAFGQLALWRLLSAQDRASGRQEPPPARANHTSGPATSVWVQDVLSASERASRRATSAASRRARGRSLVGRRRLSRPGSRRSAARSRWTWVAKAGRSHRRRQRGPPLERPAPWLCLGPTPFHHALGVPSCTEPPGATRGGERAGAVLGQRRGVRGAGSEASVARRPCGCAVRGRPC